MKYSRGPIVNSKKVVTNDFRIHQAVGNFRNKDSSKKEDDLREDRARRGQRNGAKMIDAITGMYYIFRVSRVSSDGLVFRLHTATTFMILMFTLIISSKQVVGNPIECVHTRDIPVEAFNAYCWIHSTYYVTKAMLGVAGANVAFPGVAPSFTNLHYDRQHRQQGDDRYDGDQPPTKRIRYYQWVVFVLLVQRAANNGFYASIVYIIHIVNNNSPTHKMLGKVSI